MDTRSVEIGAAEFEFFCYNDTNLERPLKWGTNRRAKKVWKCFANGKTWWQKIVNSIGRPSFHKFLSNQPSAKCTPFSKSIVRCTFVKPFWSFEIDCNFCTFWWNHFCVKLNVLQIEIAIISLQKQLIEPAIRKFSPTFYVTCLFSLFRREKRPLTGIAYIPICSPHLLRG